MGKGVNFKLIRDNCLNIFVDNIKLSEKRERERKRHTE